MQVKMSSCQLEFESSIEEIRARNIFGNCLCLEGICVQRLAEFA